MENHNNNKHFHNPSTTVENIWNENIFVARGEGWKVVVRKSRGNGGKKVVASRGPAHSFRFR